VPGKRFQKIDEKKREEQQIVLLRQKRVIDEKMAKMRAKMNA